MPRIRPTREVNGVVEYWCKKGEHYLTRENFPTDEKSPDHIGYYCKSCRRNYFQNWYAQSQSLKVSQKRATTLPTNDNDKKGCPCCKLVLPVTMFTKDRHTKSGLSCYCRECDSNKHKASYNRKTPLRPMPPVGFKWCNRGQHYVELSNFYKDARRKDGLQTRCKHCCKSPSVSISESGLKLCKGCNQSLPLSSFSPNKRGQYGVTARCRPCTREMLKPYESSEKGKSRRRLAHLKWSTSEAGKQKIKEWRERNKQHISEIHKKWVENNRQRAREIDHRYHVNNLHSRRAYYKARHKKRLIQNPEQVRMWTRLANSRRKARKLAASGFHTKEQFLAKCEFFGWRCYLCDIQLSLETVTLEHRKPLSRGGSNWIANIAPACKFCNSRKHNKTEQEYRKIVAEYKEDMIFSQPSA